jgi:hypothetical protein
MTSDLARHLPPAPTLSCPYSLPPSCPSSARVVMRALTSNLSVVAYLIYHRGELPPRFLMPVAPPQPRAPILLLTFLTPPCKALTGELHDSIRRYPIVLRTRLYRPTSPCCEAAADELPVASGRQALASLLHLVVPRLPQASKAGARSTESRDRQLWG